MFCLYLFFLIVCIFVLFLLNFSLYWEFLTVFEPVGSLFVKLLK